MHLRRPGGAQSSRAAPILNRLLTFLLLAAVAVLTIPVFDTLDSFYPGEPAIIDDSQPVRATVDRCDRAGPLSDHGFGYWWVCDVRVEGSRHGITEAVLDRSIVTGADVGRTVTLYEGCYKSRRDKTVHCVAGVPTGFIWFPYVVFATFGKWITLVVAVLSALGALVAVFTGNSFWKELRSGPDKAAD